MIKKIDFIGKNCPFCKGIIDETTDFVVCKECNMPHHVECWNENQGCTTFGCTGEKILILNDELTEDKQLLKNKKVLKSNDDVEILFESNEILYHVDSKLLIEKILLKKDKSYERLYVNSIIRNLNEKMIKAVMVEYRCYDIWGKLLDVNIDYQYLDLKAKTNNQFGEKIDVEIEETSTRKVELCIKKVLLEDSVIETSNDYITFPKLQALTEVLDDNELVEQYQRETTEKAKYVLASNDDYWRCSCGTYNKVDDEKCVGCEISKEVLNEKLDVDLLTTNLAVYKEQKRLQEEELKAQKLEQQRQEEEQQKALQEENEKRIEQVENEKKKKKKRKKIIITLIVLLLLGSIGTAVGVFFGIPYMDYRTACALLEQGKYNEAHDLFVELEDFLDSKEMVKETWYQKGLYMMDAKAYSGAIGLFEAIGDYKKSEEKLKEAKYGYINSNKDNSNRTTYEYLKELKSINYKDTKDIYEKLYEWDVRILINSEGSDIYNDVNKIKITKSLWIHLEALGGTPGEKTRFYLMCQLPSGEVQEEWIEDFRDGTWYDGGWENGIYVYPAYGTTGTLKVKVYDEDYNLIGTDSVYIYR